MSMLNISDLHGPVVVSVPDAQGNVSVFIPFDGRTVRLQPGMAATVEIKTGKRRIIEYLLSPIMKYADESLRER